MYICVYELNIIMMAVTSNKKHFTFSIDREIKKEFHVLCVSNGWDMSATVENLMANLVKSMKEVKDNINISTDD